MKLRKLIADTCEVFDKLSIEYALIGGYAAIVYDSPYITADIDFVVDADKVTLDLLKRLRDMGWNPTEEYSDAIELTAFGQFIHKDTGVVLHIFGDVPGFRIKEGVGLNKAKIEGYDVNVCSPEDYLIMRAAVWGDEDKQKAIVIVRAQGKNLNLDYLMKRAKEEKVTRRVKWLLGFQKIRKDG
ncbi:MAG: hypothetical protein A7316_03375 [Candidatus Altiarchaeales archaeon WOR_SM1_86-2]|nr:MAG: hypothetical protein A7316_03375 [Candidatus Altiarchaeales archaeon WOR_SM1_86-2]ODS41668.1 MAG: hypothetical protein A7315_00825 [Candidatus Altiarchaeales archaeon WOR_SM1_79]